MSVPDVLVMLGKLKVFIDPESIRTPDKLSFTAESWSAVTLD